MLDLLPVKFKNKKQKKYWVDFLKDELDNINTTFKEKPTLRKNPDGKELRSWKKRCSDKLKEIS